MPDVSIESLNPTSIDDAAYYYCALRRFFFGIPLAASLEDNVNEAARMPRPLPKLQPDEDFIQRNIQSSMRVSKNL